MRGQVTLGVPERISRHQMAARAASWSPGLRRYIGGMEGLDRFTIEPGKLGNQLLDASAGIVSRWSTC